MSTYFPYSQALLNLCGDIRQIMARHSFFGEWSVSDTSNSRKADLSQTGVSPAISELYY